MCPLMKEDARNHSDRLCVQEGTKAFVLGEVTRDSGAEPPRVFAAGVGANIANLIAKCWASGEANEFGRSLVRHWTKANGLESSKRKVKEERTELGQFSRRAKHSYTRLNGAQAMRTELRETWSRGAASWTYLCLTT